MSKTASAAAKGLAAARSLQGPRGESGEKERE